MRRRFKIQCRDLPTTSGAFGRQNYSRFLHLVSSWWTARFPGGALSGIQNTLQKVHHNVWCTYLRDAPIESKHHDINKITVNATRVSTSAWRIYGPVLPHLSLYCLMDQDADRKRHEARKTLSQNILQKA
ncbi:hypothetical protein L208DRAFT_1392362 [Tricholoma matsutake]|nr:hypothetical protein L208DRAFT_1392362 [Tricholoma matsutake 945]